MSGRCFRDPIGKGSLTLRLPEVRTSPAPSRRHRRGKLSLGRRKGRALLHVFCLAGLGPVEKYLCMSLASGPASGRGWPLNVCWVPAARKPEAACVKRWGGGGQGGRVREAGSELRPMPSSQRSQASFTPCTDEQTEAESLPHSGLLAGRASHQHPLRQAAALSSPAL